MKPSTTLAGAILLLLSAACGDPQLTLSDLPATTRGPSAGSLLRLPRNGGVAQLYLVPTLMPASWTGEDKLPALLRPVGADAGQGLAFALDTKRNLVGLDLDTRRVRTYIQQVRDATLGPDGALYAVDADGSVIQLVRRTAVRFRAKLQGAPTELYGSMKGLLLAHVGRPASVLEVLSPDQPPSSTALPDGPVAVSLFGDLVAVAADTGVILYQPHSKARPHSVSVPGHPRSVIFSPSGHRLYVGLERESIVAIDRFTRERLEKIDLPGSARELRGDPYGRWILARPQTGDSAWVIDIGRNRVLSSVAVRWDADLPALAAPNALLTRRGGDLVAVDLAAPGFPETGRVAGGAADFWLPVAWRPPSDARAQAAADSGREATAADTSTAPSVYLQVSSSQNPAWADELAAKLQAAGLPASVLPPGRSDESYRVVLGPYASREQAEETGRKIGMPSFIVTAQDTPDR